MNIPTSGDIQGFINKILTLIHWRATIRVEYAPIENHPSWYLFYLNEVPSGALEITDEYEICVYILHPNVIKTGNLPYIEEDIDVCDSFGAALRRVMAGMMDCQIEAAVDILVDWKL